MRILIFGDSITQGFNDPQGGWVEHLKREYMRQNLEESGELEIFNLGISGDTSAEILKRIETETMVRRWPNDPIMTILAIGVNDSADKLGKRLVPIDEYQANVKKILILMKRLSDYQLVVGLTPCVDGLMAPAAWSENDFRAQNHRIGEYERVLAGVTKEQSTEFVSMWQIFMNAPNWESMLPDGLHPDSRGHGIIYNHVKNKLSELQTR